MVLCAVVLALGCRTETIPASRLRGVVLTPTGAPIADAYVLLGASVPTGIDAPRTAVLATTRSRADGSFEVAFPATRVLRILADDVAFDLRVFHERGWAVEQSFQTLPDGLIRTELSPRPDGHPANPDDCPMLCGNLAQRDCRHVSREYFGAEDVCDFRY
ncbi:MAG: hypothetical protein ACREBE_10265 [bacterium]